MESIALGNKLIKSTSRFCLKSPSLVESDEIKSPGNWKCPSTLLSLKAPSSEISSKSTMTKSVDSEVKKSRPESRSSLQTIL